MNTIVSQSTILLTSLLVMFLSTGRAAAQGAQPVVTDTATIVTSAGTITLVLYGVDAPKTVDNFVKLAAKGFYKGILFHRVVPGFVIQAGDPKTKDSTLRGQWGTGGESAFGAAFEDELNPNAPSYRAGYVEGTLAMANRGPNSNSSQFFICLGTLSKLPRNYTIFGKVTSGMEAVRAIEAGEITDKRSGIPVRPVKIIDVKVAHTKR